MNISTTPGKGLPAGLIETLRTVAAPAIMPALAALDRSSREELTALARQFLNQLDQSASWKPDVLRQRIYLAVDGHAEAKVALDKLHELGCQQYGVPMSGDPISAIFVDRRGNYTFLFAEADREKHFGELTRSGTWHKVTLKAVIEAQKLDDLQP